MTLRANPTVIVLGAGVIGASVAYHLARDGANVTVIDEQRSENRATRGSLAWINAHAPDDAPFFRLRVKSMKMWRVLGTEITGLPVRLKGGVSFWGAEDELAAVARAYASEGCPARLLEAKEIEKLEPEMRPPRERGMLAEAEGVAMPEQISEALLAAASAHGATRRQGHVEAIETRGDRVIGVAIGDEQIAADAVVIAAGLATPNLLAFFEIALPHSARAGLVIRTNPAPRLTERFFVTERLAAWQMPDGRLIAGADFSGGDDPPSVETIGPALCARLRALYPGSGELRVEDWTVRRRPDPADGRPAIGAAPGVSGLYAAMLHSGVTFAPAVGASLAREILTGAGDPDFNRYALGRFT